MKYLVTGGAGYIGSHAVRALLDANRDIVILDNLSTGFKEALPAGIPFYEANIQDYDKVIKILRDEKIETVLHFAASISVPESVENPMKYYDNNTANATKFLRACTDAKVENFIFSSTAAVYGIPEDPNVFSVNEENPTAPISPYGLSKLLFEKVLQDNAVLTGMKTAILRYFNVSGADPKLRTGQRDPNATGLFKCAVDAALGKRKHLDIFGTDYDTRDGTGVRDFIHVSDLAEIHVLTADYLTNRYNELIKNNVLINCGYGKGVTVGEVVKALKAIIGDFPVIEAPRRPGDIPALITNTDKLTALLQFKPKYDDVRVILQHALEWERTLP